MAEQRDAVDYVALSCAESLHDDHDDRELRSRRGQSGWRAALSVGLFALVAAWAVTALSGGTEKPVATAAVSPSALALPLAAGSPSVAPATETPSGATFRTVTNHGDVVSIVTGPLFADGIDVLRLTVKLVNVSGHHAWTGRVAVGVTYEQRRPGVFAGDLLVPAGGADDVSVRARLVALPAPDGTRPGATAFAGVGTKDAVTLQLAESRTWTFEVKRSGLLPDLGIAHGWVAALLDGGPVGGASLGTHAARTVSVDPAAGQPIRFAAIAT